MGFSISGAWNSATSWAGDRINDAGNAANDARNWVGDRLDDVDQAKNWVGEKIDGAVQSAEEGIDDFRQDIVQFGEEHGGVVGKTVGEFVSNQIGVTEGALLATYDMGKGVVQLADGASKLVNPLEWATHADRNFDRVQTVANTGMALGSLGSPIGWAVNPEGNMKTAETLWNGVTQGYQDAAADGDWSKFGGRLVVDVGSMFIGAGEVNAATKGARAASLLGEAAPVLRAAEAAPALKAIEAAPALKAIEAAPALKAIEAAPTRLALPAGSTTDAAALTAKASQPSEYGVAFFGNSNLNYYTGSTATLGRGGSSFFFMPIEDSGVIANAADASRFTGRAPSADLAYVDVANKTAGDGVIYGISFPLEGKTTHVPTAADAGGWPHFLEGGHTAVRIEGDKGGFLVNPTREFVLPGGDPVPRGSMLFQLGENGSWMPLKMF
jgi:hypothetical protein